MPTAAERSDYRAYTKRRRSLLGALSCPQLASRMGVSRSYVHYIVTGKRVPSLETARRMAAVLGLTLDELYGRLKPAAGAKKGAAPRALSP